MAHEKYRASRFQSVAIAIVAVILLYGASLITGSPQAATQQIVAAHAPHSGGDANDDAAHADRFAPPYWMVVPFVLLLSAIAIFPLVPHVDHWWESNLHRFHVTVGLALVVLVYYALLHSTPLEGHWPAHHVVHPAAGNVQWGFVTAVLTNAIFAEYIPFIVLLFSLYTISGGIRITGDLPAHPLTNATFLGVGAALASFIGTTGAAMLLIRPLLETNRERKFVVHTVVFFIFTVCNCGGCLLPLGDPPLFLGYLEGVPFLWTFGLWREWLFVNGLLIVVYLLIDALYYYRREEVRDTVRDVHRTHRLRFSGWKLNVPLLLGVVLAIGLLDPSKAVPGTHWHPWLYLREIIQLGLVAISLLAGAKSVREANHFNFAAIIEVAVIFAGIFITMQPALEILRVHGSELGIRTPAQFFWVTGALSSLLDNAPTYLVFLETARAMPWPADAVLIAGVEHVTLVGLSLGAVFMGAMTYIGNGPNFMVRAIAEKAGVKMPSFFGYLAYSCLFLLPILAAMIWWDRLFPY